MLRGWSIAWMFLTSALASGEGDHLPTDADAVLTGDCIGVTLTLGFL
jgi:hypothetical protein